VSWLWRRVLHCVRPSCFLKAAGRAADGRRHRAQTSHDCSAPLDFNARHDAAVLRKARAQEVMARTMPEHAGRVVAKPPSGRDDERISPPKPSGPSKKSSVETETAIVPEKVETKVKSKAEKVYEIRLRKLRSLANPLDPMQMGGEGREKRFFELGVDGRGEGLLSWQKEGKLKVERVWITAVRLLCPCQFV